MVPQRLSGLLKRLSTISQRWQEQRTGDKRPKHKQGRGRVGALLAVIDNPKKMVILPHDNPDPDSLASAAALRYIVQQNDQPPT